MQITLKHLPPSLDNAQDNILRLKLFDHLVDTVQDFHTAAHVLAGYRMGGNGSGGGSEDNMEDEGGTGPRGPYYTTPSQKMDIYVKIAECFLEEDEIVEAEAFVTKAALEASIMSSISANASANNNNDGDDDDDDDDGGDTSEEKENADNKTSSNEHIALILRYKSTFARVLDANRKFLQAAGGYYDLSAIKKNSSINNGTQTADMIDADDLVEFLGRAATCAILAPSSAQRQRVMGLVYRDERLASLDSIPHFSTHASILSKMYKGQMIRKESTEWKKFEESLAEHQKAIMGDGLTTVERAVMEHNMVAVSNIYSNIYFSALGRLLGLSTTRAEEVASKMILDGSLKASIDELDGVLTFEDDARGGSNLVAWDGAITSFCMQLNHTTDAVRQRM